MPRKKVVEQTLEQAQIWNEQLRAATKSLRNALEGARDDLGMAEATVERIVKERDAAAAAYDRLAAAKPLENPLAAARVLLAKIAKSEADDRLATAAKKAQRAIEHYEGSAAQIVAWKGSTDAAVANQRQL